MHVRLEQRETHVQNFGQPATDCVPERYLDLSECDILKLPSHYAEYPLKDLCRHGSTIIFCFLFCVASVALHDAPRKLKATNCQMTLKSM